MKIRSKIILGIACLALVFGSVVLAKFNKPNPIGKPVEPMAPCVVEIGEANASLTYDPNDAEQSQTQKSWMYKFTNTSDTSLLIKLKSTPSVDNMTITYGYSLTEETDANKVTDVHDTYKDKVLATDEYINIYIIAKVTNTAEPASYSERLRWTLGEPMEITYTLSNGETVTVNEVKGDDDIAPPTVEDTNFEGWFYDENYTQPAELPLYKGAELYGRFANLPADWLDEVDEDNDGTADYCMVVRGEEALPQNLVIPSMHNNLPVRSIYSCTDMQTGADAVFAGQVGLKTVDFSNTMTTIGTGAFVYCSGLESVRFSNNTTTIGVGAFAYCDKLSSIHIPASVKTIEGISFAMCSSLTSLTFDEFSQLETIGGSAFEGSMIASVELPSGLKTFGGDIVEGYGYISGPFARTAITSIVLPDSVTDIGVRTFNECQQLTSVVLGCGITEIGEDAFYGCPLLSSVTIPNSVTSIGKEAFSQCTELYNISIPSSVTTIGASAFAECSNLVSVGFAKNARLTTIDEMAFAMCSSLTSITIPASVTTINDSVFGLCSSMTEITFDQNYSRLEHIGAAVFEGTGITSVAIPNSLKTMGLGVFGLCESLQSVTMPLAEIVPIDDPEAEETVMMFETGMMGMFIGCTSLTEVHFTKGAGTVLPAIAGMMAVDEGMPTPLEKITLPDNLTHITPFAFAGTNIENIEIRGNLQTMGNGLFFGCTNLQAVTMPLGEIVPCGNDEIDSMCDMGYVGMFMECTNMTTINFTRGAGTHLPALSGGMPLLEGTMEIVPPITKVTLPDNIETMSNFALALTAITSIEIPATVTNIPIAAFLGCELLTSATFAPNSQVQTIEHAAFAASGLTSLTIPASLTRLGGNLANAPEEFFVSDEVILMGPLAMCPNLTSVTFEQNSQLKHIGLGAFAQSGITNIHVPSSVEEMEGLTFTTCASLKTLTMPLTRVVPTGLAELDAMLSVLRSSYGWGDFYGTALEAVTLLQGNETSISKSMFVGAPIKSIVIPNNVIRIEDRAFYGCSALASVNIPNRVEYIGSEAFRECAITTTTIPDSVTYIGSQAFHDCCNLTSVTLSQNLTEINNNVFSGCAITNITIPEGIVSIGSGAFSECEQLSTISMPNGLTNIGPGAFRMCSALTNLDIPSSINSVGDRAFESCNNLVGYEYDNAYYLGNGNDPYMMLLKAKSTYITSCKIHESTRFIHSQAFSNCNVLTSATIPNRVTTIGDWAFSACGKLGKVVMEEGVISIGSAAFSECTSLVDIIIPNSITSIGSYAFSNCNSLTGTEYDNAYYLGNDTNPYVVLYKTIATTITSCEIHEDARIIYTSAFNNHDSLESIVIPDNVISIGQEAFYGCDTLSDVIIGNSVQTISYAAFFNCLALTSIDIPDSVITIGEAAFSLCGSLTNVRLGNGLTSIGGAAFENSALTDIVIPDSVTRINYNAFRYTGLTTVVVGKGIQHIEGGAFYVSSITTFVIMAENPPTIGLNANDDSGLPPNATIYIPLGTKEAYMTVYEFASCESMLVEINMDEIM